MPKLLILVANPTNTSRLRLEEELRDIHEGLRRAQHGDQFTLAQRLAVRPRDVQRAMLDETPQIVHFSGHGEGQEGLFFEDETGQAKLVSGEALADLFALFADPEEFPDPIQCVVLNGCYSQVQAEVIAEHVPCVIGMTQSISDRAAIEFAVGFYDALGAGRSIEFAFKAGCAAITMAGKAESTTPVLINRKMPSGLPKLEPKSSTMTISPKQAELDQLENENKQGLNSLIHRNGNMKISDSFSEYLQDTGIKFAHQGQGSFVINDFFIYPDLKIIRESLDEIPSSISGKEILAYGTHILIYGDEQSGKTTLAKKIFLDAYDSGFLPIFIEGGSVRNSNISDAVPKLIRNIYSNASPEFLLQNPNLICIVDDISISKLNKKAKNKYIKNLSLLFPKVILLAEDSFKFVAPDFSELDDFKKLEILPLGHSLRSQLITRWVELESGEEVEEQQIWAKIDELKLHVNSLIRKNVVPAKPFYLLLLLQAFQTISYQRLELTSYGHYYQHLIYQSLQRALVKPSEIDMYINILTELGRAILESPKESLDDLELREFFVNYSTNFLPVNQDTVTEVLVKSCILRRTETALKFRYRYLFYFFAAKSLADSLHKGDAAKRKIQKLVDTIHLEKSSNIVLFLIHHSKDPWILEEILYSIMDIFPGEDAASLEKESLHFLKDFIDKLPEIVMENRDAKQERLKEDQMQDELERKEKEAEIIVREDSGAEDSDDGDLELFIKRVNKAFRVTEVCGQIIRNRFGSLERDSLEMVYEESLLVSLRFLNILLKSSEYMKEEVIRKINRILEQSPERSDSDIRREAESFYVSLNYLMILAVLNKASFSLGSSQGREIYLKVTGQQDTPASKLIQEIIELQFEKRLDFTKVEKLHNEFSDNPICDRLLKHIILRHCYMHDIGFRDRQKLADKLGIPLQLQRSVLVASKQQHQQ